MPKLSPTMEEGTIVKWHKNEGDLVKEDDLLFEVATDKATVEYNALDKGYLRKILVLENQDAVLNQAVAVFTEKKDESIEGYTPEGTAVSSESSEVSSDSNEELSQSQENGSNVATKAKTAKGSASFSQPVFKPESPLEKYEFEFATETPKERLFASPLARKLASEKGIDLTTVKGSGPNERIMSRDLKLGQDDAIVAFGRRELPHHMPGSYIEEPMTPMRKVIGERLQSSKTFIPHFYVQQEVNAENMVQIREQLKEHGVKVTFNDFVMRAAALALRSHPHINSGYNSENQSITRYQTIDIAVAVSIDGGLITPIVRHADFKNMGQLSKEVKALAMAAKNNSLEPSQYKGGSFTISNLGMYGITDFQAVINPPQGAILAVGGIIEKPVVKKGLVVPGKTITFSLASDHRIIDGADAASFLKTLKDLLENPAALLI